MIYPLTHKHCLASESQEMEGAGAAQPGLETSLTVPVIIV